MKRIFGLALLGLAIVLTATALAQAPNGVATGTWRLTTLSPMGESESTHWLFKVETTSGKTSAKLVAVSPEVKQAELVNFTVKGDQVRVVVRSANGTQTFVGRVNKDGKKIGGVFGTEQAPAAAYLATTDMTAIKAKNVTRQLGIEPATKAAALKVSGPDLERKANQTENIDQKVRLLKQAVDAYVSAEAEVPKLFAEIVAKHPDTFAAGRAALGLLQRTKYETNDAELKNLADVASKASEEFGPAWQIETNVEIALAMQTRKKADLAAEYAQRADKALEATSSLALQMKVVELLSKTLADAGKSAERKVVAERFEKLLDLDYMTKVPSFKGRAFSGRKAQSDRVVVMELFTGAQCPPCVASDVAFDVLLNSYRTSELVLMQYHMHIPGPDPMTNPDTEARWDYYRKAHGNKAVPGTPTTLFNGTPKAGGGGAMAAAEKKYDAYRAVINPLLESQASLKISASARVVNDTVQIQTDVVGLETPGKDMKLRIVLVEESIRFIGSNKLRFHHHVVRSMPGGPDGVSVVNPAMSAKNEVNLSELRKNLNSYLDNYVKTKKAFPQPQRPLDLHGLRVIAFVQNDATSEILQAVQVDVKE